MRYNFDEVIDRSQTDAYKWVRSKPYFGTDDLLPLWVADMDIATPPFVMEAVQQRAAHPILGYTIPGEALNSALIAWLHRRHQWVVEPQWIRMVPGVVTGLAIAVQAFTEEGDKIVIQTPVYPPFMDIVEKNHRVLLYNELLEIDGRYEIDFDNLETCFKQGPKLLILCSPHNPGGRVWCKAELERMHLLAQKYGVVVVSDEIHADMVLPGFSHKPFATIDRTSAQNSISLVAPSKTFNIAGLGISFAIISNAKLRTKYARVADKLFINHGNIFGYTATLAAYQNGHQWLDELMTYLAGNFAFITKRLEEIAPAIEPHKPESTFLHWWNCKKLEMNQSELVSFFVNEAKLGLNNGATFGPGGNGFMRLNVGVSRVVLEQAMNRLEQAMGSGLKL